MNRRPLPLMLLTILTALSSPAKASEDWTPAIDSMHNFAVRQMDWFGQAPPLKQTFGWDTALSFPPSVFTPMPYVNLPAAPTPLWQLPWRGDIYDTSLDAIWFTERARLDIINGRALKGTSRAQKLLDAGMLLADHDPFPDGRLRTAYWANNLLTGNQSSIMAADSATGNIAYFGIALTRFYQVSQLAGYLDLVARQTYIDEAAEKAQWIVDICTDSHPYGFTMGLEDWGQVAFTRKSTEHNIDVWVLASNLHGLTGGPQWAQMADRAAGFVQSMFVEVAPNGGYYQTGTFDDGITPNPSPIPADAQAWTALARGNGLSIDSDDRAAKAMRWLLDNLRDGCESGSLPAEGVKFSDVGKNMQCEVTASAALALKWLDYELAEADELMDLLEWVRLNASPSYDGIPDELGLVATPCPEGAWTGFGPDAWYYKLLHSASSDWYGLACLYSHEGVGWANPLMPMPEPGDADLDGDVDLADLSIVAFNWDTQSGATWEMGDFDGDGGVGLADLSILAFNWESGVAGPQVPEPTTLSLLTLAGLAFLRRRR